MEYNVNESKLALHDLYGLTKKFEDTIYRGRAFLKML